ncbi:hypothetical protein EDEG_00574 [Edhazardia aedis USNM 41457]|uniref:Uncharacterized protein n=1 Tax=Edhazardia aedis (strain USNM 41457) TaxID=1003232 RepID=J9D0U8_EDHAE|nr:hypothetical protein EDEG_00574 [Edhazardia aedis USNM 41457]|eukprot:EJW01199.1 hypothetical protein EDEG_00574 [Edhazardia aedis USNM 41457]
MFLCDCDYCIEIYIQKRDFISIQSLLYACEILSHNHYTDIIGNFQQHSKISYLSRYNDQKFSQALIDLCNFWNELQNYKEIYNNRDNSFSLNSYSAFNDIKNIVCCLCSYIIYSENRCIHHSPKSISKFKGFSDDSLHSEVQYFDSNNILNKNVEFCEISSISPKNVGFGEMKKASLFVEKNKNSNISSSISDYCEFNGGSYIDQEKNSFNRSSDKIQKISKEEERKIKKEHKKIFKEEKRETRKSKITKKG